MNALGAVTSTVALIASAVAFTVATVFTLRSMSAKRTNDGRPAFYISRQITFYAIGIAGVTIYLLALLITGVLATNSNDNWASLATLAISVLILLALGIALWSPAARRQIKVFISKNFYKERYDYRREWLRLIQTLVGRSDNLPLRVRAVRALAEIIDSDQGELWLRDLGSEKFVCHGGWPSDAQQSSLPTDHPLALYLEKSHWVVDTVEYYSDPGIYGHAFNADSEFLIEPSIYVPVVNSNELIGIVRLERPAGMGDLGYEDHDLLKTAGQQIAVFLEHERAQEDLFETRQFEAFSKLTAFLMHDLKNIVSQLNLVVTNAQKFKHRPEFVDDAMTTIDSSVSRMRGVINRLQDGSRAEKTSRIDLVQLVYDVCRACEDRAPKPSMILPGDPAYVDMDPDRLEMALTHVIRNAQDATSDTGSVDVNLSIDGAIATIDVRDSGCGMDAEFIRTRLFRPFDSTKGAQGMGIGAYQIRETLMAVGGGVSVSSTPGIGTKMTMRVPKVDVP